MTGNPNLSVAFRNIFNIQYYQFITSRDISISAGGAFSFDNKGFSTNEVIDQYGKTTHSFINIPGNKRLTLFSYYTFKPFHKLLDISLSASANGTENAKIINNTTVLTRFIDYGVSFNPSFYRQDLINVECKTSFRWNNVFSNTLPVTNQRYTNLILQPAASINLVKYTILKMDYYYSDFPSSQLYEQSQRVSIFNISISQQLGKERSFTIQFSVKDIFNTSKGLSIRTYDNYVTQTSFNTIARYFMLSVVYNFSHTLKNK
jgi:hypothetical protein